MVSLNAMHDPVGKLDPQPWLRAPETVRVMDALAADGADVRFVGGCVRDALHHRPVTDIDIGTPDPPERVSALLEAAGIKALPTGLDHGTVTAVVDGQPFEVTTLRQDVETDGRHATVAYTDDWVVDSGRRDFTINALSATRDGDVFDYHDGIPDLAHGRVRFIGRAEDRVREDYLRIMRFFRFYAHYGRPPYDDAAFAACRKLAGKLATIAAERIRHELLRTLAAPEPAEVFVMMRDAHVLEVILPEATDIGRLRAAAWLAGRGLVIAGLGPDPLRRLGAVLGAAADAPAVASRLRLSNRETSRLIDMINLAPALSAPLDAEATRQLMHKRGGQTVADAAILAWAGRLAEIGKLAGAETRARREMLEIAFSWTPPNLPVGGADVQALGVEHGPAVGEALRAVEDWWAKGDFAADRDACLGELKRIVENSKGDSA